MCGCKWHGHYDSCFLFPDATQETKNPVGIDYETLNEEFMTKATKLLPNHPDKIKKLQSIGNVYIYKKDKIQKLLLQTVFKPHPLKPLCPRSCVRGAFADVYALKWTKNLFPNEDFHFYDVNSLYSFAALKYPFLYLNTML